MQNIQPYLLEKGQKNKKYHIGDMSIILINVCPEYIQDEHRQTPEISVFNYTFLSSGKELKNVSLQPTGQVKNSIQARKQKFLV